VSTGVYSVMIGRCEELWPWTPAKQVQFSLGTDSITVMDDQTGSAVWMWLLRLLRYFDVEDEKTLNISWCWR